jgi:hypothetical protein
VTARPFTNGGNFTTIADPFTTIGVSIDFISSDAFKATSFALSTLFEASKSGEATAVWSESGNIAASVAPLATPSRPGLTRTLGETSLFDLSCAFASASASVSLAFTASEARIRSAAAALPTLVFIQSPPVGESRNSRKTDAFPASASVPSAATRAASAANVDSSGTQTSISTAWIAVVAALFAVLLIVGITCVVYHRRRAPEEGTPVEEGTAEVIEFDAQNELECENPLSASGDMDSGFTGGSDDPAMADGIDEAMPGLL